MSSLKRLFSFMKKYKWYGIFSALFGVISIVAANFMPKIMQIIIDRCIIENSYEKIYHFTFIFILCIVMRIGGFFLEKYFAELLAQYTVYDIRNRLFDHIQRLSFAYHDNAEAGQLISRSTSDINSVQSFLSMGMIMTVQFFFNVCVSAVFSFITCYQLAVAIFVSVPLVALYVRKYSFMIHPCFKAVQNQMGKMTAFITQNLLGIKVIKSYTRENDQTEKFTFLANGLFKYFMKAAKVMAVYSPLIGTCVYTGQIIMFFYGGYLAIYKGVTVGTIIAFYFYFNLLLGALLSLSNFTTLFQNGTASEERIYEILKTKEERRADGTKKISKIKGKVEFKNVGFVYSDGFRAIDNISFTANPGEFIGIIGETGSGKTTLINLISRFYDVTEGEVLIDGINVKDYTIDTLRKKIGIVAQESFLFGDTVKANISYPKNSGDEEIEYAAKTADIHDFIMSLPEKYNTIIGERGVDLSGGQKQRLSIARALIMDPEILIMDDATSALDTETEAKIQEEIQKSAKKRTCFIIAQRVSSIIGADKIIVLNRGKIEEMGTHRELLAKKGIYSRIYQSQLIKKDLSKGGSE